MRTPTLLPRSTITLGTAALLTAGAFAAAQTPAQAPVTYPANQVKAGEPLFVAYCGVGPGRCATCHSPSGDLAGVADRFQGLELLQRMLNPSPRGAQPSPAKVRVTLPSGETVDGRLAFRDEFTIALRDARGWYRSWPVGQVKFTVDNPLDVHAEIVRKYTDADMHNVLA